MHGVTTTLSEVLKAVSSSSKTESQYLELRNTTPLGAPPSNISKHRDSDVGNSNPSAELSDAPMVRKRNSRCKGRKRGRTNEVKRELHYEDKLPPGRRWLYYSAYDPNMDGDDMPHCLDLAFRPSKGMKFFGPELAFAAYIFGNGLKLDEELVTNAHCDGTRDTLQKLMPGKPIPGDILVLVCSMLTYGAFGIKISKYGFQWYLPPTFSQVALSPNKNFPGILNYIKENFMAPAISAQKIFLPIHLRSHWFLILVDLVYETVSCFDSFKGCILMSDHERAIEQVLKFLEQILSQRDFYNPCPSRSLEFSNYKFLEPDVPQQHPKSNDCGIWVSQWMILSPYFGTNHKWVVNDYTRMKLAVDLVKWRAQPKV